MDRYEIDLDKLKIAYWDRLKDLFLADNHEKGIDAVETLLMMQIDTIQDIEEYGISNGLSSN